MPSFAKSHMKILRFCPPSKRFCVSSKISLQRLLLPTPAASQISLFQTLIFTLVHRKNYWHCIASRGCAALLPDSSLCFPARHSYYWKVFPRLTTLSIFNRQAGYMMIFFFFWRICHNHNFNLGVFKPCSSDRMAMVTLAAAPPTAIFCRMVEVTWPLSVSFTHRFPAPHPSFIKKLMCWGWFLFYICYSVYSN